MYASLLCKKRGTGGAGAEGRQSSRAQQGRRLVQHHGLQGTELRVSGAPVSHLAPSFFLTVEQHVVRSFFFGENSAGHERVAQRPNPRRQRLGTEVLPGLPPPALQPSRSQRDPPVARASVGVGVCGVRSCHDLLLVRLRDEIGDVENGGRVAHSHLRGVWYVHDGGVVGYEYAEHIAARKTL